MFIYMIQRTAIYIYKRVLYFKLGRLPLLKNFVWVLKWLNFDRFFNEVITKEWLITNKKNLLNQTKRKKNRNYSFYWKNKKGYVHMDFPSGPPP